ncbi:GNAT family N-acetyltransferase [Paractinoplanes atraurantiacus]|uniref:Protein N-acetyltransferase, RimJ/RimL family n=1 Tax=Paractinoplanes atraurantiacus TaxID=1036182 RepID=A0A285KIG5_9ACTN|nr:GNAT family protein [Actinoplanes atraurantiacus]SNY71226.1 Protein N-acetyltransferase, RimJ/RimL family [Actinoplanes atraurantiacus]
METWDDDGVVALRPWSVDDAEWYAAAVSGDELIQRFTSEPPVVSADAVRAAVEAGPSGFLIADAVSGERLGNIAVDGDGEVSYWVAAPARGRGVATRALRLFVERLGARELRLWAHADNLGSRTVAERAGFVREPERDRRRQVKGEWWPTVAYRRPR